MDTVTNFAMEVVKAIDIQMPSIDRPFGVHLWPIFDVFYTRATGIAATDFKFEYGDTPLGTMKSAGSMIVAYYAIIFGGRFLMKNFEPFKLRMLFQLHNLLLTLISGGLLVLFMEQLIPTVYKNGLFYGICSYEGGWTKPLVTLYYLNYLTKFLELLDTVFLVVKKKPLTFLHCYHHGATALLCYTQLIGSTSVSWVPITLNLLVHVVMYWYYFQSARGIQVWWKQWITRLQIFQFIIDLGFVYFASYTYFTSTYWPWIPNSGKCAGEEFAAFSGCGILSSYLFLFISFYFSTYKRAGKRAATKAVQNGEIAIDPKFSQDVVHSVQTNGNGRATNGNGGATNGNGRAANGSAKKNGSARSRKA